MAEISSENIAVSPSIFSASPSLQQAPLDVTTRQGSSPPASSSPAQDFTVSISPEARDASAKARTAGVAPNRGTVSGTEQESDSLAETKKTKTALPEGGSPSRMTDEQNKLEEESRKRIERQKEERRNEEEKQRLDEESADAAARRKDERKKAEKAENEQQSEKGNILTTAYEANRSRYANSLLLQAAINGYQVRQPDKAVAVIGGTSADSTSLFIKRGSNQGLSSINLLA